MSSQVLMLSKADSCRAKPRLLAATTMLALVLPFAPSRVAFAREAES